MKQRIIIERDDGVRGSSTSNVASKGQKGDTQLANINPYGEMLLKKLGGAGTRNPQTGLKQFYNTGSVSKLNLLKALASVANKGRGSDTELAHVNQYEAELLKKLGGSGTINPKTGLREYTTDDYASDFDFPLDIMPTSESSGYSGLPESYGTQIMDAVTPQLTSSITNMSQNYDDYTNQALASYNQAMQNSLKTNIPKSISDLANRGILSSTAGENILSQVYSDAATDASTKGYETAMESALLKANMPSVLGELAKLGTTVTSTSTTSDPTIMYQTMAELIAAMM